MKVSINSEIFSKAPDLKIGAAVICGIKNSGGFIKRPAVKKTAAEEIATWEKCSTLFGIDVAKFPPANKNISERFVKGGDIPKVNPLVDLTNVYSVEEGVPMGGHDLDKVPGDIEVRFGREGDTYVPLGKVKSESVLDPVVFAIGKRVQTRNWTWRISGECTVDEKSKNIILFVDTLSLSYDQTLDLLKKVSQEIVSSFGGAVVDKAVLTREVPVGEFRLSTSTGKREIDKIEEFLARGVENIIPNKSELEKALRSGKKLNVYNGIDPTASHIHLGNAVPLRKLQMLLEMGHNVTFLIGDFTALIGDTSDKDAERTSLTYDLIERNFQDYKRQAEKVLDFSKVKIVHNSDWLRKLSFEDIVKLCQHFSTGDFVGRELIRKRLDEGRRVGLHELLYPVMQGYDSYHLDTDIQLGGTDQTFNMQAGRTLQKDLREKESFVVANGFLTGTDGRKMSKSWGNAIWIDDQPNEMFGKAMSVRDELIVEYFTLGTAVPMTKVEEVQNRLSGGENPMAIKKELAFEIVSEMHGKESALAARKSFEATFQEGKVPSSAIEVSVGESVSVQDVLGILVVKGLVKSRSEARRLVEQGGLSEVGGKGSLALGDAIKAPTDLRVGKRQFLKIVQ